MFLVHIVIAANGLAEVASQQQGNKHKYWTDIRHY